MGEVVIQQSLNTTTVKQTKWIIEMHIGHSGSVYQIKYRLIYNCNNCLQYLRKL